MAAMANAIAARKTVSKDSPRLRLSAIEMTRAVPEMTRIWLGQLVQLLRQRRGRLALLREHVRDVTDLCRHAGRGDDQVAGASRHVRVHVDHVGPVAERRVGLGHRLHTLRHRQALAGQRRLVHFEGCRPQQAAVGRHDVAGLDRDDVARDELLGRDLDEVAAAPHLRLDDHHLLQGRDGGGRLALLVEAEDGVEQRQEEEDETGAELVQRPDAADAGDEQDDLHRISVLPHERMPARLGPGDGEGVRPVALEPRLRLGGRQPGAHVDAELRGDGVTLECEPLLVRGRRSGYRVRRLCIRRHPSPPP